MIFVFNCILSGCTVAVFIPKYKIMVRGEADWKRGTWNDCFYPDKRSTDSLQPVWRTKMNMHISFFSLSFEACSLQLCAQRVGIVKPSCLWGRGSERASAEMVETHWNVQVTHVQNVFLPSPHLKVWETFSAISKVSLLPDNKCRPFAWCSFSGI